MASISKMQTTKDGRRFWRISVSRGYGNAPYTSRFYWPEGKNGQPISEKVALRDRDKFVRQFEQDCADGKVQNRKEKKAEEEEQRKLEEEERAKLEALKTVRQYGDGVFMPTKLQSISENTRLSYKTNLEKHVYPVIGDKLLVDITAAMITKLLLDFQAEGHSHGSCVKLYNVLNGLFDMAQFDDSIPLSPMVKVRRPKQKKDDKAIAEADKALGADELNHVLECVSKEPLKWQAFLYLAADTGCRRGELVGMQWLDIDWKKKTVTIKHNIQYSKAKGVYDVTPKGGRFRVVDLGDDTIEVLRKYKAELTKPDEDNETVVDINEYRKKLEEERKKKESALPKWIFTVDGSDQPMFPTSPTRYFKTFGDTYNVPGFHPHMLRHTSASLSLTNGGDVKSIADRLGHKDASVTLRMYAHANDESIRAAGQAARNALKQKKEEQKKTENAGA